MATLDMTQGIYRRIYPAFLDSKRINGVSWMAEAWFWRLWVLVDDFGNLKVVNWRHVATMASPIREVDGKQAEALTTELSKAGLVTFYDVDGERYLNITGFAKVNPAGKNGKRFARFPAKACDHKRDAGNSGESKGIQNNPDSSTPSYTDTDTETYTEAEAESAPPVLEFTSGNGRPRGITIDGWLALWHGRGRASAEFVAAATAFYEAREQVGKPITKAGAAALLTPCEGFTDAEVIADMNRCAAGGFLRLEPRKQAAPGPTAGAVVPKAQAALESYMRKVRGQ
jgi:hypothetical protein